ncbi:MAG: TlpA family protein disulfide reductase [Terriglobales bacterium]
MASVSFSRVMALALIVCGVCLLAADLVLAWQNSKMRALNGSLLSAQHVDEGMPLPALTGRTLDGLPVSFPYGNDDRSALIFVFDPNCGPCIQNGPKWGTLVAGIAAGARPRVLAVDVGAPPSGSALAALGLSAVANLVVPSGPSAIAYRFRLTPQTILVGPDGHVRGEWDGPLSETNIHRIAELSAPVTAGPKQ